MTERFGTTTAPDRPEFQIKVDGTELDPVAQRDVIEVDIDERVNGHALAQILMRNWDPKQRQPIHSSQETFRPGAELTISAGYRNELAPLFSGVITAMTVRFPPQGAGVVEIEARSASSRMAASRRHRSFEAVNPSNVFTTIAQDYALSADVGDGAVIESVVDLVTDWDRVLGATEIRGWVGYVRDSELVLRPPSTEEPEITLEYGTSLLELNLREDLAHRHSPVTAVAWNTADLTPVEAEAVANELDTAERPNLAAALDSAEFALPAKRVMTPAGLDQSEVDDWAAGAARWEQLRHLSGVGACIGIPQLRCDQWITIARTGPLTDGPHYVSRARHRIGAKGYTTEFTLGLPEPLAPPDRARNTARDGGLMLGVVTDIEDPESSGRVKVALVTSAADVEPTWARVATLDAGPDHGTVFMPSVGNEVVLGFAGRDTVVLGQLFSQAHPPSLDIDTKSNTLRGLVTPSGHKVIFSDDTPSITITSGGGHTVVLDDDAGSISLTETSGNSITLSSDGVVIEAVSGDISLKASSGKVAIDASMLEAKATGPSKVESNATLDISASATLGLKGALVNIN